MYSLPRRPSWEPSGGLVMSDEPPFPWRRPGQSVAAYRAAVAAWMAHPAVRAAALVRAAGSGHAADVGGWNESAATARRVRRWIAARLDQRVPPPAEPPSPEIVGVLSALSVAALSDVADSLAGIGAETLRRRVSELAAGRVPGLAPAAEPPASTVPAVEPPPAVGVP